MVVTAPFSQKMGTQRITNRQIQRRIKGNGTISELLRDNLNVQFSSERGTGNTAGEISPENVSFHGEKFYNNNWMIDGMSNNDTVNPGANNGEVSQSWDGSVATDLPAGGTQSFWISSDMIDRADVYDSNISAKYGQFTGGVVDARLKDPSKKKASGSIEYRMTQDNWTDYYIEGDDDFYKAERITNQPKFTKQSYSLNVNQPINDHAAVLFSYNRTHSKIPFYHRYMGIWENQERQSETWVLKGLYCFQNGDKFTFTGMYSPHQSTYLRPNIQNGQATNQGGGYRLNAQWVHFFDHGHVDSYLGYKHTRNQIDNLAAHYYTWRNNKDKTWFNWCSNQNCTHAHYGGYGQFETGNKTWTAKQDYSLEPIAVGNTRHSLDFGWQADVAKAWYERAQDAYAYSTSKLDTKTTCLTGDSACIAGQQWFDKRTKYPAKNSEVSNNHYALYVQNKINWQNWEVTPGVRVDYDQFLGNVDIAPRFSASYNVLGKNRTKIFGGLNRYYAANMLAYKLREATGTTIAQSRKSATADWLGDEAKKSAVNRYIHQDGLKTPYSDEVNFGVEHKWNNSIWTAKWVQRASKDQFMQSSTMINGEKYKTLSNRGSGKSNTLSLEVHMIQPWRLKYANVRLGGGVNYSKTQSNFNYYDDQENDAKIIINGRLQDMDSKPAMDYNTPWRAMLNIDTTIPRWNLTWTQSLNYTAGYAAWTSNSFTCSTAVSACGDYAGKAIEYSKQRYSNMLTLDWHFAYALPMGGNKLELTADITNVLNSKMKTKKTGVSNGGSKEATAYKLGRQIWLGARYTW